MLVKQAYVMGIGRGSSKCPPPPPHPRNYLTFATKGVFVWDQSGIRIIGITKVSVLLAALPIPEYLDFHSGYSAPRSRVAGIYSRIYSYSTIFPNERALKWTADNSFKVMPGILRFYILLLVVTIWNWVINKSYFSPPKTTKGLNTRVSANKVTKQREVKKSDRNASECVFIWWPFCSPW